MVNHTPSLAALALTLLPWTVLAQDNTTDVDYFTQSQPNLYPQTLAVIQLTRPDCEHGPLSKNQVCDASASPSERAAALIAAMTLEEIINNTQNVGPGVPRLGLPAYNVWSEALHGLDRADVTESGEWSWSTSFPQAILSMAALNRTLIRQIGDIISTQGRAFNNAGRYGLNSYAPNINGFRSPLWGRGQETPGEDANHLTSAYAYEYVVGMQGGVDPEHLKLITTPKHFAGYDLESWDGHSRLGNDLTISQQDLAEYYTPQFMVASKYARAHSLMCSYNSVNGVPSCANSFFLQTLLRDSWDFPEGGYVSSDCDAVYNVWNPHGYADDIVTAAADSLRAGTDIDCGQTYPWNLNASFIEGYVSRDDIELSLTRLYTSLVRAGWFDGMDGPYRQLTWKDVETTDAWNISYEAAAAGITLLKNDGTLPLSSRHVRSLAVIGPWANATTQMQGNYYGAPPYLVSPLAAAEAAGLQVHFALGTNISGTSRSDFGAAMDAAKKSDAVLYLGGIDNSVEAEGVDRMNLTWPGNQLDLIDELSRVGKPLVVFQMGGGQVDSSSLKDNRKVNSLVWGGYPGQSGGNAILDIVFGKRAPAGRLVTTQYPAEYAHQFPATEMSLRPQGSNPGQTYMWYKGTPVYPFGHGLFYTEFKERSAGHESPKTFNIKELLSAPHDGYQYIELVPFVTFEATVENVGGAASPYTGMVFASTTAGPKPLPIKWLAGFDRLDTIKPGRQATFSVSVSMRDVSRVDEKGNRVLYPGKYELALNNERSVVLSFTLEGEQATLENWPLWEQEIQPSS